MRSRQIVTDRRLQHLRIPMNRLCIQTLPPASNQLQHDIVTAGKELSMKSSQVVLITGSSTGFGRLFTETLARKGHTVFATMRDPGGRNAKNAAEIRALAQKESLPIHVLELDVTDDASMWLSTTLAITWGGWPKRSPSNKRSA